MYVISVQLKKDAELHILMYASHVMQKVIIKDT